jgi:hypothetical protein
MELPGISLSADVAMVFDHRFRLSFPLRAPLAAALTPYPQPTAPQGVTESLHRHAKPAGYRPEGLLRIGDGDLHRCREFWT